MTLSMSSFLKDKRCLTRPETQDEDIRVEMRGREKSHVTRTRVRKFSRIDEV